MDRKMNRLRESRGETARAGQPHVERVMLVLSKSVPIRQNDVTLRRRRFNPTSGSWILIDVSFQTSLPRSPGYRGDVEQWKDSSHVTPRRGRTRPSGILIFLSLCYTRVSAFLCAGQCNTSPLLRTVGQERVWQLSDTLSHVLGHWRRANAAKLTPRLCSRLRQISIPLSSSVFFHREKLHSPSLISCLFNPLCPPAARELAKFRISCLPAHPLFSSRTPYHGTVKHPRYSCIISSSTGCYYSWLRFRLRIVK